MRANDNKFIVKLFYKEVRFPKQRKITQKYFLTEEDFFKNGKLAINMNL